MEPIKFDGVNVVFGAEQPEYMPLPAERVQSEYGQVNTCWELSPEEIKKVRETGHIFVSLLTFGQPLQPILVSVDKPEVYNPE